MTYLTRSVYEFMDALDSAPRAIADLIRDLAKTNAQKKYLLKKKLEQLELEGVVRLSGEIVKLTAKGRNMLDEAKLEDIIIPAYQWDGVWQIVAWDIPADQRSRADLFRNLLKKLDFTLINKSFWTYPFYCKEEIGIISKRLKISDYVIYLQTDTLPHSDYLITKYHLTKYQHNN